ncbi:holo-ACP synthase [Nibricoccus sp. IMCC34717]|uniref:holo-ACP synthase n=1 Tax=Nibricoccus sp. IMCC34717 TaxID=3034021 RepID=UPI003850B6B8
MIPLALPPGGLLLGLGADLCDVARIREVNTRQGARFLEKVFTAEEIAYCGGRADPAPHYAARFAAKEAVAKAFTTGIGAELGWHSISVRNGTRSEPLAVLDDQGMRLLRQVGGTDILLTLTHTETTAMAVAAIIRVP